MIRYWGYHMVTAQTKEELRDLLDHVLFPSLSGSPNPDPELTEQELLDLLNIEHCDILKRFGFPVDDDDTDINMITINQVRQYAIAEGFASMLHFFQPGVLMWKTFEDKNMPVGMDTPFKYRQFRHMTFASYKLLHM